MSNREHIPAHIFDWIARHELQDLDQTQREEALRFLSAEDYRELRRISVELEAASIRGAVPGREQIKQDLTARLREKHRKPAKVYGFQSWATIRNAAALLLFLASCGLTYYANGLYRSALKNSASAHTDTVIVTRQVASAPDVKHDTVWIAATAASRSSVHKRQPAPAAADRSPAGNPTRGETDITILTPEGYEQTANSGKGTSLNDDSLVKKYSFVSM